MEISEIKIKNKIQVPKVHIELENGNKIYNTEFFNENWEQICVRITNCCFDAKFSETEIKEFALLLNTYIETRYGN